MDDLKCFLHQEDPLSSDEDETAFIPEQEGLGEDLFKITNKPRFEFECVQSYDSDVDVVRIVERSDSGDEESPRERSEKFEKYGNIATQINWGGVPVKKKTVRYDEEVESVEKALEKKLKISKKNNVKPEVRDKLELLQQRKFHRMLLPARNSQKCSFRSCKPCLVPNSFRPKNRYGNEARVLSRNTKVPVNFKEYESQFLYYKRKVDHQASQCNILRVIETADAEVQATVKTKEKYVLAIIHKQNASSQYPIPKLCDKANSTILKNYQEAEVQVSVEQKDKAIDPPLKIFYYEDLKAHSNAAVQTDEISPAFSDEIKGYSDEWESCSSYDN